MENKESVPLLTDYNVCFIECGANQIYCSMEDSCIPADLKCNQNNDCYAGEDEDGCGRS